jgi:Spo0E like sporulation regulatory protein
MILRTILDLSKKIDAHRQDIHLLSKNKGLSHPDVITTSRKLTEEIEMMQHIIDSIQQVKKDKK